MNKDKRHAIELLAPARDAVVAVEAIRHGADAVYMGAARFGARAQAGNSIEDMARVCDFAHNFDARVYATVNTIVYDHELKQVERLVNELYRAGVDAIIVQDLALLRLDLPPIALHASTQCDLRTPDKARFLAAMGFSQLVLARELSLDEIRAVRQVVDVPLEAFVHGALCVCYSGRCQASQVLKGRSANRGECAQICRLSYDLEDGKGNRIITGKHLLSLRDLNLTDHVAQMIDAGVSSFKIEGRLKDVGYVKNVVSHYRRVLDDVIAAQPNVLRRASVGESRIDFTPDVLKSFNLSEEGMLNLSETDMSDIYGIEAADMKQFAAAANNSGIKADEIVLVYERYCSALRQEPESRILLPLKNAAMISPVAEIIHRCRPAHIISQAEVDAVKKIM